MSEETIEDVVSAYGVSREWLELGEGDMFAEGHDIPQAELEHIGDRIRLIRKKAGLTQAEFAREIGRSKDQVYLVEAGKSAPSEYFVKRVCEKFRIERQWLVNGIGEMLKVEEIQIEGVDKIINYLKKDSVAREVILTAMGMDRAVWLKIDRYLRGIEDNDNQ